MKVDRIDVDFLRKARRRQPLGLALLAAGALAAAGAGVFWSTAWSAQATQARTLADMEQRDAEQASKASRPVALSASEQARKRAIQRVSASLQTPWSDLLAALETAPRDNVALLAIEPSVARQQVRLTAEARDPESMIDYLTSLQADARLSQVVLVSHQVQAQAPGKPVRFTLQAAWGAQP
jgi:Tfp pilus assembly protein PilN